MTLCNCKCSCGILSAVISLIIGVIAAFLQITGAIAVTAVFLWVVAGVALGYLGILLLASAVQQQCSRCGCICVSLSTLLAGALGSIFFAAVLLAVGIAATSVISAILVGLLVFFLALTLAGSACYVKCLADCGE